MHTLRILPDLRSSVVESMPAGQELLFTSRRTDADAALLARPDVRPFTWRALRHALRDPDLEVLEVAEPLWLGEWRRAVRCIAAAKAVRVLRRRPVAVATYAIENADARERLPTRAGRLRLGLSLLLLDAIVFGTTGASENYLRTFGWALRRVRHTVLTPQLDACSVCPPTTAPREPVVLFLGTPSERKGFPTLMRAWELTGAADRGWRLVVADPSGAASGDLPAAVSVTVDPPRPAVHELLRTSAVVAMPSVRRPGWREQIGLPLVEGLTHGCRVVTTPETGLAPDLLDHPLVFFTEPGDAESLADGLRRAMDGRSGVTSGPPGHTKTDVVAWWRASENALATREPCHAELRRTR
ncbi:glycosyltransferase [Actinomycetospora aeridis]|uniref:Glycosyltransferase n=1 Tax=Actinomycetospora aeridis TaxID=3129231 RepID=A0ABU8N8T3_9PSEU